MSFFESKPQNISRNYDFPNSNFAPRPLNLQKIDDANFCHKRNIIKDFIAIFSAVFLSSIGYGILAVMIALQLEKHVENEILISLSTIAQITAGVVFSRFLPKMGRKIGMINSIYIGCIISAICAIALYFYVNYLLWLIIIYITGTSFFIHGITRNTIIIDLAPAKFRSMIIAIGATILTLGNSVGPFIINFLNSSNNLNYHLIAASFFLISLLPLKTLKKVDSYLRQEKTISLWRYVKNSPKIMLASFSVGYATSAASAFVIIYGIEIGLAKEEAVLLLSFLLFGTLFYIPIGYLSDIVNRHIMMFIFGIISLICCYLLTLNLAINNIKLLLFLLFGSLSAIKLPALVLINEKYKPTQRLAVNSAFSRFGLIGNICGLLISGIYMNILGPNGLWFSLITILLCFLSFCLVRFYKLY